MFTITTPPPPASFSTPSLTTLFPHHHRHHHHAFCYLKIICRPILILFIRAERRRRRHWQTKKKKKKDAYTRRHTKTERKRASLSPPLPPSSSMPFQLKSAVVIKFQQGLGATVQRADREWWGHQRWGGGGQGGTLTQRWHNSRGQRGPGGKAGRVTNVVYSRALPDSPLLNLGDI